MAITASVETFDDELEGTPYVLEVTIGNGDVDELVTASLSGTDLETTTLDEYGTSTFDVPIPELIPGSYTLTLTAATNGSDTIAFTVAGDPLDTTVNEDDDLTAPTYTPDPVNRWQLIDSTTGDGHTYTFPKNPEKWTTPWKPQFLTHAATTAPDGEILAWQGGERAWRFQFSGIITTQAEYEALEFWSNLRRRFWLIDHRNVTRYVTFEHFDARARVVPNNPWVHDYTVSVIHFLRQGSDSED